MQQHEVDLWHMRRPLALPAQGQGFVEPNPMVGCVIARGAEIIGEGWHRRFGQAHAEVEALRLAGERAKGAAMFVTLEPCCHHGKTPPCTKAIAGAGLRRVVVAQRDPFPAVDGGGLAELRAAGMEVEVGLLEDEARAVNAPYLKLVSTGRPWVLAKWAMTLDGKTATRTGASQWISGEESRRLVHQLRGRVDAIVIGRETARMDNPLLTARPPGPRTALRVVVDTRATLASSSRLLRTAQEAPLLVAVGATAPASERRRLEQAGCEVFVCEAETHTGRLDQLLGELGRRQMTNVFVEGGGRLLGTLLDAGQIDEVHIFVAPKLLGGQNARSPIDGEGVAEIAHALELDDPQWQQVGPDLYLSGRIHRVQGPGAGVQGSGFRVQE
jgi:diaminohydroxyphosphoribosylaminopyrimidine deaminase / 5-amino-6-(5-phosphoribosylamino)uracil reductase